MSLKKHLRQLVKTVVFGGERLPDHFFVAQKEPQQEVKVWLLGAGEPIDVTQRHCQASSMPFTICIEFPRGQVPREDQYSYSRLALSFCENGGKHRILGKIGLQYRETLECGDSLFLLFHSSKSAIYCVSRPRLWSHSLWQIYSSRRNRGKNKAPGAQRRAIAAMFCCPRPVSLVSVADEAGNSTVSPVNVMGNLNEAFFGFSIPHDSVPEKLVRQTRRVVLSSVPMKQAPIVYALVPKDNEPINWKQLTFPTRPSEIFRIPVPQFACRVRELQVEQVRRLGFHTFFLARVLSDERLADVPEFCVVQGFYEDWRVRNLGVDKHRADAEDLYVRSLGS
ncbi:hypothetical protein ACPOL_4007 [Acidisarcina polymorpha]|uniref:Flavin reductase like domain-containing protein n=1 Tax=Acidisarcina polymorpha TaxID=2211140 RepID=A0A2Z5G456_9BACT|nr:hypothetical protein [Acidisarcina polymorpha]AXC13286.1 hypothetical protein ACPOL_4007 [Acidisarcina polymorpha]